MNDFALVFGGSNGDPPNPPRCFSWFLLCWRTKFDDIYLQTAGFSRYIALFYRYIAPFLLANLGFFLYLCGRN